MIETHRIHHLSVFYISYMPKSNALRLLLLIHFCDSKWPTMNFPKSQTNLISFKHQLMEDELSFLLRKADMINKIGISTCTSKNNRPALNLQNYLSAMTSYIHTRSPVKRNHKVFAYLNQISDQHRNSQRLFCTIKLHPTLQFVCVPYLASDPDHKYV